MRDTLKDYSMEQMKTAYMAERILRDEPTPGGIQVTFSFGEPAVDFSEKTVQRRYGSHVWNHTSSYMNLSLPDDWYDRIYMAGVGKVRYLGKSALVLDASPLPIEELRSDLRMDGFSLWRVKMPVYEMVPDGPKTSWGYQRMKTQAQIDERYMVAVDVGGGEGSLCFAAKHMNAAAANLKKSMLQQMQKMMGV